MRPEKSFEDYLKAIHAGDYHGTDDDMPDAFDDWCISLDADQYIEYADMYAQTIRDFYQKEITKEAL